MSKHTLSTLINLLDHQKQHNVINEYAIKYSSSGKIDVEYSVPKAVEHIQFNIQFNTRLHSSRFYFETDIRKEIERSIESMRYELNNTMNRHRIIQNVWSTMRNSLYSGSFNIIDIQDFTVPAYQYRFKVVCFDMIEQIHFQLEFRGRC